MVRTRTHTHTRPATAGQMWWNDNESEMTMNMRCKLLNQDAKRGTQKKREEQTPTGGRWKRNQTSGGGGRRKRLNQPTTAKPKRRTQPTCREEDTWDRGPMGDKLMKRCIHINVQSPLIGLNGHKIKSTLSTAVVVRMNYVILRAQLNLTRATKKKETTPERHVLIPECQKQKRWSPEQRHVVSTLDR